jgi:hypothetical protein
MDRASVRAGLAVLLAAVLASSCQTRQPVEPTTPDSVPAGAPVLFHPAVSQVPIMLGSGRYPTLFDGASRATWIEPASAAATPAASAQGATPKATKEGMDKEEPTMMAEAVSAPAVDEQARMMSANFVTISCDIASVFSDISIAYDVVGFRGVQVYLLTADGQQIPPVQTIIGSELRETQQGALKKYHRKNVLLFPKEPVAVPAPLQGGPAPALRLVLEAQGSMFYFEWPALLPGKIGPPKISEQEWVKKGEAGYRAVHKKERAILHKFD